MSDRDEEVARLLRRVGELLSDEVPGTRLWRFIVADAHDPRRPGVELIVPARGQGLLTLGSSLVSLPPPLPDGTQPVVPLAAVPLARTPLPDPPPETPKAEIDAREAAVLSALRDRRQAAGALWLANHANAGHNSGPFRTLLARMRRRGLLGSHRLGYSLAAKGLASLTAWEKAQLFDAS